MTDWQARAEAAEAALREAREELKKRDNCSFMGPMRDCPTHGESKELAEVRELLRRLISEMRTEIKSKSTPIIHEASTLHWVQELEQIVRAALEPALHELECRIAESFAQACDMWANLIADIQLRQAETVMQMRDADREKFFNMQKERAANRTKVKGFAG